MRNNTPKSDERKVIEGTFRPDRSRNNPDAEPLESMDPPKWLGKRAQELWREWAPGLTRQGLLTVRDVHAFGHLCDAAEKMEKLTKAITAPRIMREAAGKSYPHIVSLLKFYSERFQKFSERFGFTPLDRQRLDIAHVIEEKPTNRFAELEA